MRHSLSARLIANWTNASGHDITDTGKMSENILVDGKPLHLLRVVDLREELKKRGIKATGTKPHLQELLKTAILSVQEANESEDKTAEESKDKDSQEENSNESSENSATEEKVASISINEETETIKLTIRSSPRKSEPTVPEEADSETESSQSETDSSDKFPQTQNESIYSDKSPSPTNDTENENGSSTNDSITNESKENDLIQVKDTENEGIPSKANNHHETEQSDQSNLNDITLNKEPQLSPIKPKAEIQTDAVKEQQIFSETSPKKTINKVSSASGSVTEAASMSSQNSDHELTKSESPHGKSRSKSNETSNSEESTELDSKSKPSIRERLLSHSKSITEEDASKPVQKKRRWGSSQTNELSILNKGISSDKLKQIISESAPVVDNNNSSIKVSRDNTVNEETTQSTNELINNEPDSKEDDKSVDVSTNNSNESTKKSVDNEGQDQADQGSDMPRPMSPAKNPESTVLFVTGLVRPYTLPQLKKLLSAVGPIDEEKFWIDKIKSKCYVVYTTVEEAAKTRVSLHNLKWPQSSPKNLSVDFATLEDIDRCLNPENYEDLPPKAQQAQQNKPVNNHDNEKKDYKTNIEKKDAGVEISKGKYDIILNEPINRDNRAQPKNSLNKDDPGRNVREWDRNKVIISNRKENEDDTRKRTRPSPQPSVDKKDKTRERSKSPESKRKRSDEKTGLKEANKRSESPAKMLEDLFRKTKATPYIYWLPLTDEQAVEREKQRAIDKEKQTRIVRRDNSPPPNKPPAPLYHNLPPRDRPKLPDFRRRSPPSPRRKRSLSQSPRRYSRYSRSRSPDHRRFSPRRRR